MTLDDAIEYYSKTAETLRNQVRIEDNDYMDKVDEVYMCERLAEWLNELKLLRERIDAQPEKRWIPSAKSVQNVPNDDLVSRKTVIEALLRDRQQADALMDNYLKNGYMALRADAKVERNRIEKDIAIVEGLPSVQPERKKGKWGNHGECPFCSYLRQWEDDRFCGNCGADMRGEQE